MNSLKKYTLLQLIFLAFQIIIGKIFFAPSVRIVKLPFSVLGMKNICLGKHFTSGKNLRIECFSKNKKKILFIGNDVKVNDYVHIACNESISIGDNVLIGSHVLITDHQHGKYNGMSQDTPFSKPDERALVGGGIVIEPNVWIGDMVAILPNVTIGEGSIIGTLSVVSKSIPPYCIAVGSPCKVIKKYDPTSNEWKKIDENLE